MLGLMQTFLTGTSSLEKIKQLHRMGLLVDGMLDNYFRSLGLTDNKKRIELAKMDFDKQAVLGGRFFLTRKGDEWVVVDMFNPHRHEKHGIEFRGNCFLVDTNLYDMEVTEDEENILVTDLETGKEKYLIVNGLLNFEGIKHKGVANYTYQSSRPAENFIGYPALRFNNSYADSLRVHWIIYMMNWGIEIACYCVGSKVSGRKYDIHHKVPFSISFDSSPSNLVCMRTEDHEELHGIVRGY